MKPERCGNCGSKNLSLEDQIKGHFNWKDYPLVYLTTSLMEYQCLDCKELITSSNSAKKFDDAINASITGQVKSFIDKILLRENVGQLELSQHLGLSPEYLSEIKSGRKIPKFQTFNFLKSMALDRIVFELSDPEYDISDEISA